MPARFFCFGQSAYRYVLTYGLALCFATCFAAAKAEEPALNEKIEQTTPGLQTDIIAERRIISGSIDDPMPQLVPVGQLNVGDEVFYTVTVQNVTATPIANATVIKVIPRNTRYIAGSAVGPAATVTVSIDGGVTFAEPDQLQIPLSAGNSRAATADDYTHIRWQLGHALAPGATALLRFRCSFK